MSKAKRIAVDLVSTPHHPDAIETFERIKAKSGVGNIHRTLANSPTVFKAFIGISHALRYATLIDPIERELAICCALEMVEGDYQLEPHRRLAQVLGASEDQIINVSFPDRSDIYTPRQQALLRFAMHFAANPSERGDFHDNGIETILENRERIELGLTLAMYIGMAHFTAVFDVPDDDFNAPGALSAQLAADAAHAQ